LCRADVQRNRILARKQPQPFWREQTKCYYIQIGKKQHRLSPDEQEAWRLYHEMMANWSNSTKNGFARSVQRGMRWAEGQGLIERTPIPKVEKPSPKSREMVLTYGFLFSFPSPQGLNRASR